MKSAGKLGLWSLAVSAMLMAGAASANPEPMQLNMTTGVTDMAAKVYDLHMLILLICVVIGVIVFGAMIIAMATALSAKGVNYQQCMHVTAIDTDLRAVHMAYLQFSLLGIPATVVHGNTLTLEQHSVWHTPAHHLGLWGPKLRRGYLLGSPADDDSTPPVTHDPVVLPGAQAAQGDLFSLLGTGVPHG